MATWGTYYYVQASTGQKMWAPMHPGYHGALEHLGLAGVGLVQGGDGEPDAAAAAAATDSVFSALASATKGRFTGIDVSRNRWPEGDSGSAKGMMTFLCHNNNIKLWWVAVHERTAQEVVEDEARAAREAEEAAEAARKFEEETGLPAALAHAPKAAKKEPGAKKKKSRKRA